MNKNIIITGASRGIGREIALRFAKEGANLLLTCKKNKKMLEEVCLQAESFGGTAHSFIGDLSIEENCQALFEKAASIFPSLDLLINNAGISHVEVFQDSSYENWLEICHTNLSAALSCAKKAIPFMLSAQSGRILNISSVWGNVGASCEVEYSTTKAGIHGFTRALAKELAPAGIAVNALACGFIDTEMNQHLSEEEVAALVEEIPAGRIGSCQEVAQVVYLLSQAPTYLTGQIITLDGGWT